MKKLVKIFNFGEIRNPAAYPVLVYLVIAAMWIFVSEYLFTKLVANILEVKFYHLYNLSLFVAINGVFMILLLRGKLNRLFFLEQLGNQALFDPLTHLPNRTLFYDRLQQAMGKAQRENQCVAVLIIGISRLREIYNSLGHRHGDLTLKETGIRLQKLIRQSDTISRIDEYLLAICLSDSDREGAIRVAGNIMKVMEEPLILEGMTLEVELNIGIALYPKHAENSEHLFRCAEVARGQAKGEGVGFAMYTLQKDQHTTRTLTLLGELRQSIDQNQLFMV
ncbi:MAG: diguanylate cyclase domain-containing protein [Nitrospiria bacterium]